MKTYTTADLERLRDAAAREVNMRRRVYPNWVRRNKMTQAKADAEIMAMQDIYTYFADLVDEQVGRQGNLFDNQNNTTNES